MAIGGVTVEELQQRMSSHEFAEWNAFSKLEPFGVDVDFYSAGIVASTIANVNKKKGAPPFTPNQFVPKFDQVSGLRESFARLKAWALLKKDKQDG